MQIHNVSLKKNCSKHSSNTLLRLLRIVMRQTLLLLIEQFCCPILNYNNKCVRMQVFILDDATIFRSFKKIVTPV